MASSSPAAMGELDPGAATGELGPAMGELGPGGLGELDPGAMGELGPAPWGSSTPAAMGELNTGRLAVSGDDGHGELGPGGLGELGGGGQEELDLGAAMEGARPRRPGGAATARTSSAPAAWRSSTLARPWGELDPGRHGGAQPRPAAAPRLAVGGGDGHGELDLGADMESSTPAP